MSKISVRVDDDLKEQMNKHSELNWSEIIRNHIKEVIKEKKEKNLARAVLMTQKLRKKAPEGFNTTNVIRKFRDKRR